MPSKFSSTEVSIGSAWSSELLRVQSMLKKFVSWRSRITTVKDNITGDEFKEYARSAMATRSRSGARVSGARVSVARARMQLTEPPNMLNPDGFPTTATFEQLFIKVELKKVRADAKDCPTNVTRIFAISFRELDNTNMGGAALEEGVAL
ncbi:hypothetical protein BDZ97DRAFT_1934176 [Flammula alnicola]|nr:hypothetical protein BDZ97DRAFT_1934176 [Flammula alnicola]